MDWDVLDEGRRFQVVCMGKEYDGSCEARGPERATIPEAIAAWNSVARPAAPRSVPEVAAFWELVHLLYREHEINVTVETFFDRGMTVRVRGANGFSAEDTFELGAWGAARIWLEVCVEDGRDPDRPRPPRNEDTATDYVFTLDGVECRTKRRFVSRVQVVDFIPLLDVRLRNQHQVFLQGERGAPDRLITDFDTVDLGALNLPLFYTAPVATGG